MFSNLVSVFRAAEYTVINFILRESYALRAAVGRA